MTHHRAWVLKDEGAALSLLLALVGHVIMVDRPKG